LNIAAYDPGLGEGDYKHDFAWQSGYGAFSVGFSQLEEVRRYIAGQEEHHRKMGFQDEFRLLLERYEVAFDERYVWDWGRGDETLAGFSSCSWPGTQGSARRATLIVGPKLFTGGEESSCHSPQPTVNNFARRGADFCEHPLRGPEKPAVTPRWMTNKQPASLDELAQSFAPARRLDSKRILRCLQPMYRYKAFAESKPACPHPESDTTVKL
jgi:hypothetical protein